MATDRRYESALAPDVRAALLSHVAEGGTVDSYARTPGAATTRQVWRALAGDPGLESEFRSARRIGAEALAESTLATARTASEHPDDVAHRRLQVDTMRWLAKAWAPATYGDASRVTHAGDAAAPVVVTDAERAAKIAAILSSAAQQGKASEGDAS
jgi:hypothetical protein